MNTLQDLRATLDQHAASVDDHERHARPAAVRERVRGTRRRRATAAAVAAVVALLASLSVIGLVLGGDDSVEPAGVLDVDVPEQVQVSGTTYVLDEVRRVTPGSEVALATSDQLAAGQAPAVALVATGLGDGRATLFGAGSPLARLLGEDTTGPLVRPTDASLTRAEVELEAAPADAQVGLAVYRPTSADVFPTDRGDRVLVAQDVAEPGDSAAELEVEGSDDDLTVVTYCTSDELGLEVNGEVDGERAGAARCERFPVNATNGVAAAFRDGRHTVRAVLTAGDSERPTTVEDGTLLGVAVYRWTERRDVRGTPVSESVWYEGRQWVLDEVLDQTVPGSPLRATVDTGDGDRLLGFVARGGADVTWEGQLVPLAEESFPSMGSVGYVRTAGILLVGDRYEITATPRRATGDTALLVYRPE